MGIIHQLIDYPENRSLVAFNQHPERVFIPVQNVMNNLLLIYHQGTSI
jgi:hypothetical protein